MKFRTLVGGWLVFLGAVGLAACAASEEANEISPGGVGGGGEPDCEVGEEGVCQCSGGGEGTRSCEEGTWGPCDCLGNGGQGGADPCGDGMCIGEETCRSCSDDCGQCAPCDIAPECDAEATIPPPSVPHFSAMDITLRTMSRTEIATRLADQVAQGDEAMRVLAAALDPTPRRGEHPFVTELRRAFAQHEAVTAIVMAELARSGMDSPASYRLLHPERMLGPESFTAMSDEFPGGTIECGKPYLRIKMDKVKVHEAEDWPGAADEIYCLIQAEAGTGAELRLTPLTPSLEEDGGEYQFSMGDGVFWGQIEPAHPGSHLLLTYDCLESDTGTQGWQNLLDTIGEAATDIGGQVGGEYGWIFTTAGGVANIVSASLALNQDDRLLNAQQTVLLDDQLELTNGYFWTVRADGTHGLSDWDWELTIKAWGCAEFGIL